MMKRFLATVLTVCMLAAGLPARAADTAAGLENFEKGNVYDGGFADVAPSAWYVENVKSAYEYGLMTGNSATVFNPTGKITVAEVLVIASRMHDIYNGGEGKFTQGSPWYQVYVDYALENALISNGEFQSYAAPATRAEFATVLARVLPEEELEGINVIETIPDVPTSAAYADSVYRLYTAGILTGSDKYGTFHPNDTIQRCEVAAIVTRMVDVSQRKRVVLELTPGETASVEISGETTIEVGEVVQWTATVSPSTADQTVSWTVGTNPVVTVDRSGNVMGLREGSCDVTATASNGATKTVRVTVVSGEISSHPLVAGNLYYTGTLIPDYTSVTGIELAGTDTLEDGSPMYVYPITKSGEYYEAVDYMGYLYMQGWEEAYQSESDDGDTLYYGFVRNGTDYVMVVVDFGANVVGIIVMKV